MGQDGAERVEKERRLTCDEVPGGREGVVEANMSKRLTVPCYFSPDTVLRAVTSQMFFCDTCFMSVDIR